MNFKSTAPTQQTDKIPPAPKPSKRLFMLSSNKGRDLREIPPQAESPNDHNKTSRPPRTLGGLLLKTQEEERSRIARELHDEVAQRIVLLCLKINELRHANENSALEGQFDYLAEESRRLGDSVRDLSHKLHSHQLQLLGLKTSLELFCKEFALNHDMVVMITCHDMPRELDEEVALCFYRVAQEALRNAAKHSNVHTVRVVLARDAQALRLSVADEGIGFSCRDKGITSGIGLSSMRERMQLIGGQFAVKSRVGVGTTVEAKFCM
jgi:signal transduction histidine kinase